VRGLFALSGDPVTRGHLHIIRKCLGKYDPGAPVIDELVVWVGNNDDKAGKYLLEMNERMLHVTHALSTFLPGDCRGRWRVIGSNDLLVDVVLREGIDVIFRGVRDARDRAYEESQMGHHDRIMPGIKDMVVFVHPDPDWAHVSSSLVKAMAQRHVDIGHLVPLRVKHRLEVKLHRQFMVGICGRVATGKTWVAKELEKRLRLDGIPAHHLNLDKCIRDLYEEDTPGAQKVRDDIADLVGKDVLMPLGDNVNTAVLKAKISSGEITPDMLKQIHTRTKPHVLRKMREWLADKAGVIILEWALLVENDMASLVNGNVIVVRNSDQSKLLAKRGVDPNTQARFDEQHLPEDEKIRRIQILNEREKFGNVIPYFRIWDDLGYPYLRSCLYEAMPSLPAYYGKATGDDV